MKKCIVEDCDKGHLAKGYCAKHYKRMRVHGDLNRNKLEEGGRNANWLKDFLKTFAITDDCIIWPFARGKNGYPRVRWEGRTQQVIRIVCEAVNGSPENQTIVTRHTCNNGSGGCINPAHLLWGTPRDNIHDQMKAGTRPRGESHANSKLTEEQVLEIVRRRKGGESLNEIAKDFNISFFAVSDISRGKVWSWLTGISR